MVAFNKIKAGDTLYDCRRTKMGNTTISRMSCWPVLVVSVDPVKRTAMCRWNVLNAPTSYNERRLSKLRRSPAKGSE